MFQDVNNCITPTKIARYFRQDSIEDGFRIFFRKGSQLGEVTLTFFRVTARKTIQKPYFFIVFIFVFIIRFFLNIKKMLNVFTFKKKVL